MTSSESDEAIYPNTETGFLVRPNKNILFPLYSQLVLLIPSLETSVLRQRIHNLPLIQLDHLISLDHIKEAFLLLSFLGSSYVWGQYPHDQVDHVLPINISLAWTYVSHQLGLYPVISYAAVTFYNLVDITHLDTLKVKYLFTGLRDEEWFYLVSVAIELAGKNIISVVHELLTGTINLPTQLQILKECIEEFIRLLRMREFNDPKNFYNRVRPYMNGWENNGKLPNGVYYTGINDPKNPPTPTLENLTKLSNCGSFQKYAGGSAGQSPIIHVIDALLSISHYSSTHTPSRYIYEMRNHMPKDYREYILKVEAMALKSLIGNEKEKYLFNECIDAMKRFRDEHLRIVSSYIIVPGNSVKNEEGVVRGTGGTDLLPFLKQMRDETKDASIS